MCKHDVWNNNMISCPLDFYIHNRVPTGTIQPYAALKSPVIPAGWLLCDGSIQSAVDYTELAVTIYNMFTTTSRIVEYNEFVLPDMQEKYLYPSDSITDRIGSFIASENPKHNHKAVCDTSGPHQHHYETYQMGYAYNGTGSKSQAAFGSIDEIKPMSKGEHSHNISMDPDNVGSNEFNPNSIYLYYIIKY